MKEYKTLLDYLVEDKEDRQKLLKIFYKLTEFYNGEKQNVDNRIWSCIKEVYEGEFFNVNGDLFLVKENIDNQFQESSNSVHFYICQRVKVDMSLDVEVVVKEEDFYDTEDNYNYSTYEVVGDGYEVNK